MKKIILSLGILGIIGGSLLLSNQSLEKNISSDTNVPNSIEEKYVYEAIITADTIATDPKSLYEYSELVLIADYQKDVSTKIFDNGNPYTTSEFKIERVIKNSNNRKLDDSILVRYLGGVVTVEELLKTKDEDFKQKIGADIMTQETRKSAKIKFSTEDIGDSSLKEHPKRILFINYNETTNDYIIVTDQYGMVSFDNNTIFDSQTKKYTNYSFLK